MYSKIKVFQVVLAVLASGVSLVAAAATSGESKAYPAELSVSSASQMKTFVREWDPRGFRKLTSEYPTVLDKDGKPTGYPRDGWWKDGEEDDVASEKKLGGLWLRVTLTAGQSYVVTSSRDVQILAKEESTFTTFKQIVIKGVKYSYIRNDEWTEMSGSRHEYYVYAFGGFGSVGGAFSITFGNRSIDEILAATPGTWKSPIPIDASQDGSRTIDESPCREPANRWTTAYSAALKANEKYVFRGVSTNGIGVLVTTLPEVQSYLRSKGTLVIDQTKGTMTVELTVDYTITVLVMPDDKNWEKGNVSGGTLSWLVGGDPVKGGVYCGKICGVYGRSQVEGLFKVEVRVKNSSGSLSCSGTLWIGEEAYEYSNDGDGWMIGTTTVGGKSFESYFMVELTEQNRALRVYGTAVLGAAWEEYEFEGDLAGDLLDWGESLLPFDPAVDSADKMGIDAGALKGKSAGDSELIRVHGWATVNNVAVSTVKTINYSDAGDPSGLAAEAYLLDCPADAVAVESAKGEFVITAFDPLTGEVVVHGDKVDADPFGNGVIEIRTAPAVGGPFQKKTEERPAQLFYRAFLVRELIVR